jgi:hypothetical protein
MNYDGVERSSAYPRRGCCSKGIVSSSAFMTSQHDAWLGDRTVFPPDIGVNVTILFYFSSARCLPAVCATRLKSAYSKLLSASGGRTSGGMVIWIVLFAAATFSESQRTWWSLRAGKFRFLWRLDKIQCVLVYCVHYIGPRAGSELSTPTYILLSELT